MRSGKGSHVRRRGPRIVLPPWVTYAFLALFVVAVVGAAYLMFNGVKGLVAHAPLGSAGAADLTPDASAQQATQQAAASGDTVPDWTGGRVTILLMGIDERQSEYGPWRTDTMILLTLDPATKTAGMLSIPRDLWVEIPDYGVYDRINTAHFRGDADHYPGGGGPALAVKTVQQNFGVSIDYYVEVNFQAFVQIIDQIGCVPITVTDTIDDPTYPAPTGSGYDPFHIDPGNYCMGGETLLKYARTRATFGGDFDRAKRQQQVLYAIRDQIMNTGELPTLLARVPQIYNTLQDNVRTDMTEGEIISLARVAAQIPREDICSAVIAGQYIEGFQTLPDGSQVVIPNRTAIRQLVLDIFSGGGQCNPQAQDLQSAAVAEKASITVLNGTRQEGIATSTGDRLTAQGLNVISVGNADRFDYANTIIYNYTGKTSTARYIAALLGIPETAITAAQSPSGLYDVEVVLGADYVP